jgi:S1-C subfamily serine protease
MSIFPQRRETMLRSSEKRKFYLKWFVVFFIAALIGFLFTGGYTPQSNVLQSQSQENIKIYQTYIRSTVTIYGDYRFDRSDELISVGTGCFIDNTHILTCFHVVNSVDADTLFIQQHEWTKIRVSICLVDESTDLAVLEIEHPNQLSNFACLSLRPEVEVGERVFMIGTPYGLDFSFSIGTIMRKDAKLDFPIRQGIISFYQMFNVHLVQISSAPGFSGSPLIGSDGKLVGIHKGHVGPIGAAITGYAIKDLLSRM